jgi:ribosomal protein S18 acetylase RimI-like enzyme
MTKCHTDLPKIKYVNGTESMLDEVKVMWEALNHYMLKNSTYFQDHFRGMTFQKRKIDLLKKATEGLMRVDIAVDEAAGQKVGYLVSSINWEKTGEIDSIFVYEPYRGMGIGDALMQKALAWIDQNGATGKIVEATVGNEQIFGFYCRYGFLPRKTLLIQVKSGKDKTC